MSTSEPMDVEIDEDAQSRQMAVYGRESMQKLKRASVLVSGLNGLGAEVAKNVILANVRAVTLHDSKVATKSDCGAQFYLSEADEGKNRAHACAQMMQELNPGVAVSAVAGEFPLHELHKYQVVVAIDVPLNVALKADAICRAASPPIAFIRADIRGLCGGVFVDLGDSFTCADPTGEAIKTGIVESISPLGPPVDGVAKLRVQCVDDEDLTLDDGDHITFGEVGGLGGLNGAAPMPVSDCSKGKKNFVVSCPAAAASGAYTKGGLITEVRQPKVLAFQSLEAFGGAPGELWEIDESKMAAAATSFSEPFLAVMGTPAANARYGRSGLLHLGFRALDAYAAKHGELPPPVDAAAAEEVCALARQLNGAMAEPVAELDEPARLTVLKQLAMGARSALCPMAAIFGGIVGQEVVKATTGKFHPLTQGFYFDALECLPSAELPISEFQAAGAAGRYADQVAVFGASFQAKLAALNIFLVGSGALGCEFIKNLALMGVATEGPSKVTVTDDDIIEKSNLSRQFLFRNHDVGTSKALAAVKAARVMNPGFHAAALQDRVSPETENVFTAGFWSELDVVVNALDNVKARLYVDSQCVFHCKPLLESGTLGTKCNTQMVLPHLTENYGASRDPPEKEAPQCAVHNFPHNIDQCLVLAHSEFVGNFDTTPREVAEFLAKGPEWAKGLAAAGESASSILDKLRGDVRVNCGMGGGCRDVLVDERSSTWAECVGWARRKFASYFTNRIAQLLHNFPHDAATSQGVPFWSPPKRVPSPIAFSQADPLHMQFVVAAANLRAHMVHLAPPADCRDASAVAAVLATSAACEVPPFSPFSDASIETDSKDEDAKRKREAEAAALDEGKQIETELASLGAVAATLPKAFALRPNEFEKDDDANFHMDFISAFGNLRARNYGIDEIEKFQAKLKAGRIIPAIATTTAMATGFVCLELYKVVAGAPLTARRNLFANLALPGPLLMLSEPMPATKIKSGQRWDPDMYMDVDEVAYPEGHTLWDKLLVPSAESMTLGGLIAHFATAHKLKLLELLVHDKAVYSDTLPNFGTKNATNAARNLVELLGASGAKVAGVQFYALEQIIFQTVDGDDVTCAKVVLQLA